MCFFASYKNLFTHICYSLGNNKTQILLEYGCGLYERTNYQSKCLC